MQNDVLRFVKNVRIKDMISRVQLHKEARLLSHEQRREKQLLILMYKLSQKGILRKITHRATRLQENYVFKIDTKIGRKYENSPFYIGTKLWDSLPRETQFSDNICIQKKDRTTLQEHVDST